MEIFIEDIITNVNFISKIANESDFPIFPLLAQCPSHFCSLLLVALFVSLCQESRPWQSEMVECRVAVAFSAQAHCHEHCGLATEVMRSQRKAAMRSVPWPPMQYKTWPSNN